MKQKEIKELKKGDFIKHKQLGLCAVDDVTFTTEGQFFGIHLRPLTNVGIITLIQWSGVRFNRMLETTSRMIIEKIEDPVLPKLLFKSHNGFEVHKWKKAGEVSDKGRFSTTRIETFDTMEEAVDFKNS